MPSSINGNKPKITSSKIKGTKKSSKSKETTKAKSLPKNTTESKVSKNKVPTAHPDDALGKKTASIRSRSPSLASSTQDSGLGLDDLSSVNDAAKSQTSSKASSSVLNTLRESKSPHQPAAALAIAATSALAAENGTTFGAGLSIQSNIRFLDKNGKELNSQVTAVANDLLQNLLVLLLGGAMAQLAEPKLTLDPDPHLVTFAVL